MRTKFIKYSNFALLFAILFMVSVSVFLTSCEKEKEDPKVDLYSFGPMPIARGAELSFIGVNLDKVSAVVLPDNITVSTFNIKTSDLLTVTVPQEAVPGLVVLKTPQGDITTKTEIGFSEPISIASFSPAIIKPGEEVTITGDYLNLVGEVIFTDRIKLGDTAFTNQSRTEIKVLVPETAQTGKLAVSDAEEDPIIVYAESDLTVKLPVIETISPNPVKAGTELTITGTDLDLVDMVTLGGDKIISTFVSQNETEIVLEVPDDTKDGIVTLIPGSGVNVNSDSELVMVVPTVSVAPTTIKNGNDISVTGTNLDLIDQVIFGGDKQGIIVAGGTETQIDVTVPDDATSGVVRFVTNAAKEVLGPDISIIDPVFTSFSPTTAKANTDITITGTDLDLVIDVFFVGEVSGTIQSHTETQIVTTVPVGAKDGKITLLAQNGVLIESMSDITVPANLPDISGYDEPKGTPGQILTINGTNLLLIKELIFPGDITATAYGAKSDTQIEVYVPLDVPIGNGFITMITYEGEQGLLPELFIGGTDPVVDPALMINDFEVGIDGHDLNWDNWGGAVELGSDPSISISGNYMHLTLGAFNGWTWIWGCNHDQLPKVSVTKADHVLKLDVNITTPFAPGTGSFTIKLGGNDIDIGHLGIENPDGSWSTIGWVTVTIDLATYGSLPDVIPASGDWGMTLWTGVDMDLTGLYIDNIRFEHK